MVEYILNGETIKVSLENEAAFLEANPSATKKVINKTETSWWRGEEGFVPDELEFWKSTDEPGKSQGAGQSQNNQQENTELPSETGSSESVVKYKIGNDIVKVNESDIEEFEKQNPEAELTDFAKGSVLDIWTDKQNNIPKDNGFIAELIISTKDSLSISSSKYCLRE